MHPAFASVFLCECPVVCGRKMKPLQLGHSALLESIYSPFILGGVATAGDIVAASWACSRDATEAMAGRRWWHRRGKPATGDADRLREYIAFHMQAPSRWADNGESGPAVPWQWIYAARLCRGDWSKLGEAWNTPMLEATARCFVEDAMAGDKSIRSEAIELMILDARKKAANG